MFWKKNKQDDTKSENNSEKSDDRKEMADKEEIIQPEPSPIRRIIDGKMYDTSKAKNVYKLILSYEDIPDYDLPVYSIGGEVVNLYKGNKGWFIEYHAQINHVAESWVRKILGKCNVDKYIELFGEVEEA